MKQQQTFILIIIFLLTSLTSFQAQGLKRTIKTFTQIMSQTQVAQAEFVGMLKPLIDPSSNVDSLCIDYYQHWKYNKDIKSFPLKIKIGKIDKHSKDRATVQISNIWNWPTGEKYFFLSESTWIKKDDKWYRTDQPAKIIEKRKIEEK